MSFEIALFRPEIPPNTGNIARLCVGIGARLHIIGEPSFDISEKAVRRAGLDYWEHLQLILHQDWNNFLKTVQNSQRIFLITKFGETNYTKNQFFKGDFLVFGRETSGLPKEISDAFPKEQKLSIPMPGPIRSINLSNSVAIVAYEALRQILK
jgi:tRNA (cytidine/uridine-2'-O-)-methyltransferase